MLKRIFSWNNKYHTVESIHYEGYQYTPTGGRHLNLQKKHSFKIAEHVRNNASMSGKKEF